MITDASFPDNFHLFVHITKKQELLKVVISCIWLLLLLHSFVRYVIYDDL